MAVYEYLPHPGSSGTETLLWSSTSTSSGAFTATLSQSATDFKRIRIEYTTYGTIDEHYAIEINMDDKEAFLGDITNNPRIALGGKGTTYWSVRFGYFVDNTYTQIYWTTSYRANNANSNTAYMLPKKIYGIK